MRKDITAPFLILVFFAFGCGMLDRFKGNGNANDNRSTPTAAPTATATPTPAPSASPTPFNKASLGTNFLAFGAGTIVVSQTSQSETNGDQARQLIDEARFGWYTAEGAVENQSITLELPARTKFKTFVFDTHQLTSDDGKPAKDVLIEVSDESATSGFQTVLTATLKDSDNHFGVDNQTFAVERELPARFVRYTAKNNYGSKTRIYTGELYGYGEQEPKAAVPNVSGTYKFPNSLGELHLKQEGNSIIGCYDENEGLVEGTIDGRVLTLTASEEEARSKGKKTYYIAANVLGGGKTIMSTWWGWSEAPTKKSYDSLYTAEKTADKIGSCKHLPDLDGAKDVAKDNLEKELAEKGKAILYGINFDFNSDVIKPESKPTLDKVVAILKEKPDWKFAVEGHTDNIGGAAFNQTLSEKRAASVVKYLTDAGITADRLTSKGYGLTRPLAPNDSEAERAQNRRVELIKQ